MDTFVGCDLGQLVDFTAAVVVRRSLSIGGTGRIERDSQGRPHYRFDLSAIRRYPLGTTYTSIIAHLAEQLKRPELGPRPKLVLDGTGVGVAVVEMFRSALKDLPRVEVYNITITSGRAVTPITRFDIHCAKLQLCGAIRAALESGRLKVPPGLEHADTLKKELQDFKIKITDAANETFSAREGAHDDLVLATALPIWLASLPHMEMQVMAATDQLRTGELAAADAVAIADAEIEALAREKGRITPKMLALAKADPLSPELGWHPLPEAVPTRCWKCSGRLLESDSVIPKTKVWACGACLLVHIPGDVVIDPGGGPQRPQCVDMRQPDWPDRLKKVWEDINNFRRLLDADSLDPIFGQALYF
jgi:hypothetical protein